ncbi:MAG: hypothetical protein Q7J27_14800 [Syntrophales bacterium]|nr:hypothetical protein [Syntrophales bacterium]
MKIEAIKNLNVTVLFTSPINHLLVSPKGLLDLFKVGDQQKDQHTFVEAPSLKVFIFPNRKKEFAFEGMRIIVNDKSEVMPKDSEVIDDFEKIIKGDMVEQDKVAAYGFNYDAVISPKESNLKISDFVGSKIASIQNIKIKSAGINIVFEKAGTTYVLEIKPIGNEQKFFAHFNAHFNSRLPSFEELKKGIDREFLEFKDIIEKI